MKRARMKHADIMKAKYVAAPGAPFGNQHAQEVGQVFEDMTADGIPVTTPAIVDRARPLESVIHPDFEWDDTIAAELHREDQARRLMQSVCILVTTPEGQSAPARAAWNVVLHKDTEDEQRGYVPLQVVVEQPDLQDQVRQQALAELRRFWFRFSPLGIPELQNVFNLLEGIVK